MTTSAHETPTTTVPTTDLGAVKLGLVERSQQVRRFTEQLCEPLVTEDYVIQSMPDVSPTKWHIAHVSWFFETFLLTWADPEYPSYHPRFAYLFNSYYNAVGPRHCRPKRGLISRPTVEETYEYRQYVNEHMLALLDRLDGPRLLEAAPRVTLGLHHEQQHQELMLMDIKHVFSQNPLYPVYAAHEPVPVATVPTLEWVPFSEGVSWIGHEGPGYSFDSFAFDNEGPLAVHGGWRIRAPGVLALGRLVRHTEPGLEGTALLGAAGRRLVGDDPERAAQGQPGRARLPCELL